MTSGLLAAYASIAVYGCHTWALSSARTAARSMSGLARACAVAFRAQKDGGRGALAGPALDEEATAVGVDDAIDDREPQARAARTGREERVLCAFTHHRVHPFSGVDHVDREAVHAVDRRRAQAHGERAVAAHG